MNIPIIIYNVANVLSIVSLVVEILTCVISFFCILGHDAEITAPALDGIFSSGVKIRNSALCFLVMLFLVANKSTRLKGMSVLASISGVCKTYAMGSLVVFALGIIISVIIAGKRVKAENVKSFGSKVWRVGMVSSLVCFCLAYFFYIP